MGSRLNVDVSVMGQDFGSDCANSWSLLTFHFYQENLTINTM